MCRTLLRFATLKSHQNHLNGCFRLGNTLGHTSCLLPSRQLINRARWLVKFVPPDDSGTPIHASKLPLCMLPEGHSNQHTRMQIIFCLAARLVSCANIMCRRLDGLFLYSRTSEPLFLLTDIRCNRWKAVAPKQRRQHAARFPKKATLTSYSCQTKCSLRCTICSTRSAFFLSLHQCIYYACICPLQTQRITE